MPKDTDIIATKTLRRDIDEQIQNLKKAELERRSRERSLAITKLQEAVMWLGMDLKAMNGEGASPATANPYPDSKNPGNTVINPTADELKL